MRVFWALVAVLVIVAIGIPVVSARSARQKAEAQRVEAQAARDQAASEAELARRAEELARRTAEEASKSAAVAQAPAAGTPQVPVSELPPAAPSASEAAKPVDAPATAASEPAPPPLPTAAAPDPATAAVKAPAETAPSEKKEIPGAETRPETAGAPAPEAPAGPKIVTREDGSMLVDDRFVVKGKGTVEAPYEVTWELLVSANETYDPRQGRKKIPGRISMLDGKIVRLTGNVAYPMFVEQPRELLSMLNQWDGCCIGVPPTPYDAVEVHLRAVVDKDQRLATFGVVEGRLEVKPYLAGDWLVGLYVMENAALTVKEYGGFGS